MALLNHKKALPIFFDAIEQDDIEKLLTFKDMNWDLHTSYQNGQGLLYHASFLGKTEIVHTLVSEVGIDVNIQDPENGWTALHYAVLNEDPSSRLDTIYTLVQLGADTDILNNLEYIPSQAPEAREKPSFFEYSMEQKMMTAELTVSPYNISISKMAKLLQIKYTTFYGWVNKYREENSIPPIKPSHSQKLKNQAIKMSVEDGMTGTQIAERLGIPRDTVIHWIRPYKKELYQRHQKLKDKAIEMFKSGINATKIAEELKVPARTVAHWIRPYKEDVPKRIRRSYSQETKDEVIELFKSGMKVSQIAKELEIPASNIHDWVYPYKKEIDQKRQKIKDQAIEMFKSGISVIKIAEELKIPEQTVSNWLHPYKEDIPIQRPYSQETKDEVIELFKSGMKISQIAKELEIPASNIHSWVHPYKEDIQIRQPYSQETKDKVIELFKSGMKIPQIAKELEIPARTISRWISPYQDIKDRAIKMYKSGVSVVKIAKKLNLSTRIVSKWIRPYKEKSNQRRQKLKDKAIEMFKSGMSVAEVAEKLDISEQAAGRWIRLYKKKNNIPIRRVYSQEQKDKAIEMYKSGMGVTEIAEELEISKISLSRWSRPYKEEHNQERQKLKDKVIRMSRHGMNDIKIAEELRIPAKTISRLLRPYKKKNNTPILRVYSQEQKDKTIEMFKSNMKVEEIAEKLDISEHAAYRWIREYKEENGLERRKVESYPPDVKELVVSQIIEYGDSKEEVAEEWNIPKDTISGWLQNTEKDREKKKQQRKNLKNLIHL